MDVAALLLLIMAGSVLIYFVGAVVLMLAGPLAVGWAYWHTTGDERGLVVGVMLQAALMILYWGYRRGKKARESQGTKVK